MSRRNQSIKRRLVDGIDWLIDAATLGEYGFEPVYETGGTDCREPLPERAQRSRAGSERASSGTSNLVPVVG